MDINELLFIGMNKYGQAGIGQRYHNHNFNVPKSYAFPIFIKQISCGAHHSALLTIDGNIYTMGSNIHGALGANSNINYSFVPTLVQGINEVTKIDCGPFHMCAISEGLLYSWGKGIDGQLGHGNTKNMSRPQKIEGLSGVDSVSCGTNHTLVLTSTNDRNDRSKTCLAFGNGIYGQLGSGQSRNSYNPTKVKLQNIQMIAAGDNHSLFFSQDKIYSCGDNSNGQLGILSNKKFITEPTPIGLKTGKSKIAMIQAKKYSMALTDAGEMYVWGLRPNSEPTIIISEDTNDQQIIDIRLGSDCSYGLTTDGSLYSWGITKGIEKEGAIVCKSNKLMSNGRAVLDFSVGDGYVMILGDIVKQIPYSSFAPATLGCFDDDDVAQSRQQSMREEEASMREVGRMREESMREAGRMREESMISQHMSSGREFISQSHFLQENKESRISQAQKRQFFATIQQDRIQGAAKQNNTVVFNHKNNQFAKNINNNQYSKTTENNESKRDNESLFRKGLSQISDFNNYRAKLMIEARDKSQLDEDKLIKINTALDNRSQIKVHDESYNELHQDTLQLIKTPSSSILCEPMNFLKESTRKENYEIRKATINESVFKHQNEEEMTPLPMRKKKYSYSFIGQDKQNKPEVEPAVAQQIKQKTKQNKIDRIMNMLEKSNNISSTKLQTCQSKTEQDWGKDSEIIKSNRMLRLQLRDKQLKISNLQEQLSRKEMEIEAQRQLIKFLRDKNSSNYSSIQNN